MAKQYQHYTVRLTEEERETLTQLVRTGTESAKAIQHANVLLASDVTQAEGKLSAAKISALYHLHPQTVHEIRKHYCQEGLERAVSRKERETPPTPPKITGDVEAKIISLACSQPT